MSVRTMPWRGPARASKLLTGTVLSGVAVISGLWFRENTSPILAVGTGGCGALCADVHGRGRSGPGGVADRDGIHETDCGFGLFRLGAPGFLVIMDRYANMTRPRDTRPGVNDR